MQAGLSLWLWVAVSCVGGIGGGLSSSVSLGVLGVKLGVGIGVWLLSSL